MSAEREGFEPSNTLRCYWFSRPTQSTTLAPLRDSERLRSLTLRARPTYKTPGVDTPGSPFILSPVSFFSTAGGLVGDTQELVAFADDRDFRVERLVALGEGHDDQLV